MRYLPTPKHRLLLGLGSALLAAACLGPDTGTDRGDLRSVLITNESGASLWLFQAIRDGWPPPQKLGDAAQYRLSLAPGRYAVGTSADQPQVPLPLPTEELGYTAPMTTEVTVWPWPDAQPQWCWIPPGPALRGDDLGIGQEDERPVSTPDTDGFWLASHETSNAQYAHFLNSIEADSVNRAWLDLEGRKCRVQWYERTRRYGTDAPELPVVTVSYDGARAYCEWLTKTTGVTHRLPTETEWEKAARGPGSRVYAYGDTFRTPAANQESGTLRPIGQFQANGFGLFDMTGNAFEWNANLYDSGRPDDDGTSFRALRGGSFVLDGIFVRNSMRMRLRPAVRADDVGFRVLREPSDTAEQAPSHAGKSDFR